MAPKRTATVQRRTRETDIELTLAVDGTGESKIETGIPFFDHLLTLFARHGSFDLQLRAKGDVEVDYHHTVEDVGIVLGQAFAEFVVEDLEPQPQRGLQLGRRAREGEAVAARGERVGGQQFGVQRTAEGVGRCEHGSRFRAPVKAS